MDNQSHTRPLPPARRDTSFEDRAGEVWADIPGLDGYFIVSNQGRIKRLEREIIDSQGGRYILPAKIRLAQVNKSPNVLVNDSTFRLQVVLQHHKQKHSFMVQRLVYCMFVKEFDLHDQTLNVVPRNGDGFDIRPENLVLMNVPDRCMRTYVNKRLRSPKEINPEALKIGVLRSVATTSRQVSQYNDAGMLVDTFSSVSKAERQLCIKGISLALRKADQRIGGFYWRYGNAGQIDMKHVQEQHDKTALSYRQKQGKPVTQFDHEGNIVAHYLALSEAARAVGIAHKSLSLH